MDYKDMFSQAKKQGEAKEVQQKTEAEERERQAKESLRNQRKREYDFIASIADEVKRMLRGYMEAHGCPNEPLRDWGPSIQFDGRDFITPGVYNHHQFDPNRMVATWTDGWDWGSGYYHIRVEYIFVQTIRKTFFGQTVSWDALGFVIDDVALENHRILTTSHLATELARRKPFVQYPIDWS